MPDIIVRLTTRDCKYYFLVVPPNEVAHVLDFGQTAELFDVSGLL